MLKLNNIDFELNALFSFELLKKLLLELAKSQSNLEKEMKKMKISNDKRDKIIIKLKESLGVGDFFDDELSDSQENESNEQESIEEESDNESNEPTENEHQKNESDKQKKGNDDEKNKIKDEKSEINKQKNENEEQKDKKDEQKNENVEEKNNDDAQKSQISESQKNNIEKKDKNKQKEITNSEKTNDNIKKSNDKQNTKDEVIEIENSSQVNQKKDKQNLSSNNKINETPENNENYEKKEDESRNNNQKEDNTQKEQNKNKKSKDKKNKLPTKIEKTQHKSKENKNQEDKTHLPITNNIFNNKDNSINVSPDLIRSIARQAKENKAKIAELTKKLKKETEHLNKNIGDKISENNELIKSDFSSVNKRIDEILENNGDFEKKVEDCMVKCSTFDIYEMFKDSGDGTVDATKVLCKALEEKVFKKFDLVDARYRKEAAENLKNKNYLNSIGPQLDKMKKDISKLFEENVQKGQDIRNVRDDYEKENQEIKNIIENNDNKVMQKIDEINNELNNNLKNKINDIENQINDMKKGGYSNELLGLGFRSNTDQEVMNSLEKKINDLRRKLHDLESSFKLHLENKEIDDIRNELKDYKLILDKKITKDNLKELYNLHLNVMDEIGDLKEHARITYEDLRKINNEISRIFVKLENIEGNILLLQNNSIGGNRNALIDFTKYVEQKKFTDTVKPILKEIEKIYKEIDSLRRDLTDNENEVHSSEKKERVNILESDLNTKINEIKSQIKRFVDKADFHKNIKQLEIQIKTIDINKKSEGDSWLMAKRPIKCFNCASCEANIKNVTPSNEYLAWNKYPQGEKIYRMGQGFSHMLQMMTSEFVKSIGENAENENNTNSVSSRNNLSIGNSFLSPMSTNGGRERSDSFIKINNREQGFDEKYTKRLHQSGKGKVQLPRVLKIKNNVTNKFEEVQLTDDDLKNKSLENKEHFRSPVTPKIMRIVKKDMSNTSRLDDTSNENNDKNKVNNHPITEASDKKLI